MAAIALPLFQPTTGLTGDQFETRWEQSAASSAALTKPKERAFLVASVRSNYRVVVTTERPPAWVGPTISGFIAIQTLPDNWDSYAGKKICRDLISRSLDTLGLIMEEWSPAPSVVPLGDGGVQLEWHRKQQDLEIAFTSDDAPEFFYANLATGVQDEGFASDLVRLSRLLRSMA